MRRSRRRSSSSGSQQTPSRPFLRLGISKGFTYTYIPPAEAPLLGTKGTITGMWLNGTPIDLGDDLLGDGELVPGLRW